MEEIKEQKGQQFVKSRVLKGNLCTNCGACVDLCPYHVSYKDHVSALFDCDIEEGRCFAFCPRTETDLQNLRESLYSPDDLTPEVGAVKGFYVTRAADPAIREKSQHGGTVTALMHLAVQEGLIDTAVMNVAFGGDDKLLPGISAITIPEEVLSAGRSSFTASPTVAGFNRAAKTEAQKIGIVALPCQALALAKMRMKPVPDNDNNIDKLKLVIGLFCGWTLSYDRLGELLKEKLNGATIAGIDTPPSQYQIMEVITGEGEKIEIPLDEVNPCVRENCSVCFDMTAEFSDISVGSARLPEGWDEAKKWNQVIARSETGAKLMELAREKKVLEFRDVPEGNLERLKKASMNKKREAVEYLKEYSGSPDDLVYIKSDDPVFKNLL